MQLENLCIVTTKIVGEVGSFIRDEFNNFDRKKVEIKGFNSLVSYVDKQAEEALVEELELLFPEAGFITEEDTKSEQKEYNWIIDPLDGTTNFIHGLPICSVSVGLEYKGKAIMGVVLDIMKDECYYAWDGGGAFMNDKEISVSKVTTLSDSLIATGFPYYDFEKSEMYLKVLHRFMQKCHGVRRLGSAALDLAFVASGKFESYYEYNLNSWDVAAGAVIVKEAGGYVSDFKGGNDFLFGREIVASCGVHQEVLDVIRG